jgi:hypothetical protein
MRASTNIVGGSFCGAVVEPGTFHRSDIVGTFCGGSWGHDAGDVNRREPKAAGERPPDPMQLGSAGRDAAYAVLPSPEREPAIAAA